MALDESRFRQLMGHFPSGVTVLTTSYNGRLYGMTVSSFCSLSLRPPLVLVCVDRLGSNHEALLQAPSYAVNILEQHQEHLSRRFASRDDTNKFDGVAYQYGELGMPLLDGVLASFECRITERLPGGDHTIFVGEVMNAIIREGAPLLYYRGGYGQLRA